MLGNRGWLRLAAAIEQAGDEIDVGTRTAGNDIASGLHAIAKSIDRLSAAIEAQTEAEEWRLESPKQEQMELRQVNGRGF